jgi:hypothetical protein
MASQSPSFGDDRVSRIWRAIEWLSEREIAVLLRFARYRLRALGVLADQSEGREVLHDAAVSLASGARHWPEGIDFFIVLRETIRSLTDARRARRSPETSLSTVSDGSAMAGVTTHDPERIALARDELRRVYSLFADDVRAQQVLEGLSVGLTGPEVQRAYQLTVQEFNATVRRIDRRLLHWEST